MEYHKRLSSMGKQYRLAGLQLKDFLDSLQMEMVGKQKGQIMLVFLAHHFQIFRYLQTYHLGKYIEYCRYQNKRLSRFHKEMIFHRSNFPVHEPKKFQRA